MPSLQTLQLCLPPGFVEWVTANLNIPVLGPPPGCFGGPQALVGLHSTSRVQGILAEGVGTFRAAASWFPSQTKEKNPKSPEM